VGSLFDIHFPSRISESWRQITQRKTRACIRMGVPLPHRRVSSGRAEPDGLRQGLRGRIGGTSVLVPALDVHVVASIEVGVVDASPAPYIVT
jgi:hypothetical protein